MLTNIKKIQFLIINVTMLLVGMQKLYSQDANNYLSVSSTIKNVNINSVATVENEQVQTNAFTLTIKSRNDGFNIYAYISYYNSSNGYVLPSDMLAIKLNTVTPSRTANFNEIPITGGNQLIISSTKTNTSTVTYNYNMYIGPLGYDSPPGTYNATIMFTMTDQ
jgi:hypothetical protein